MKNPPAPLLALAALAAFASAQEKPNILFILSDDHSAPWIGCYGTPNVRTPNLDRFAAQGMRFNRFFCVAPQCVPSRAGMMTGRSAVAARMTRFTAPLPREETIFPEVLRAEGGYYTGVCGRTFHLDGSGRNAEVTQRTFADHNLKTFQDRMDFVETGDQRQNPARFEAFLDQVPKGRPFFLWVNTSDPHHPWDAADLQLDPKTLQLPAYLPDTPAMRESFAAYLAEINRLDGLVQSVLAVLDRRSLTNNTLVVFTGDNGMALPHGKGSLYDPGLNTPLLVRWPGRVKPGTVTDELISGEDYGPTLLAAAGLKAPARMSGKNFLPLLLGQPYQGNKYIFAERGVHGGAVLRTNTQSNGIDFSRMVRSARHKLIYNFTTNIPYAPVDSGGHAYWKQMIEDHAAGRLPAPLAKTYFSLPRPIYELYDLQADPAELNNLSGQPGLATVEKELKEALTAKMILDWDYLPLPDVADPGAAPAGEGKTKAKGKRKKT
jgi:arylsulfatase A-like enzyme